MSQVRTVLVPSPSLLTAVVAAGVLDKPEPAFNMVDEADTAPVIQNPKKAPQPPSYEKQLRTMSTKQLRGELKRVLKKAAFPRTPQAKYTGGRALFDTAFATILEVFLDGHEKGKSPFPR